MPIPCGAISSGRGTSVNSERVKEISSHVPLMHLAFDLYALYCDMPLMYHVKLNVITVMAKILL